MKRVDTEHHSSFELVSTYKSICPTLSGRHYQNPTLFAFTTASKYAKSQGYVPDAALHIFDLVIVTTIDGSHPGHSLIL